MIFNITNLVRILAFSFFSFHLFFVSVNFAESKIITVPDEFTTIQAAINSASKGDTVLVMPGSYHEFLVLKDSIVLMSDGIDDGNWMRAARTIIHSEGLRDSEGNITPVVNCADGCVLDGFEITGMDTVNHHLPGHSHAVQNRGTSSTIKNCIVHDNGSTGIGSHEKDGRAAVPIIIHNKVYRNFGIGIGFNHFAKGVARDNISFDNREVGIGVQNGAAPLIENNKVYGNGWNGISVRDGSKPTLRNNMIYSNGTDRTGSEMPPGAGAGIGADSTGWLVKPNEQTGPMIIENNTVFDNPSGGIMVRNNAMVFVKGNKSFDNETFQVAINGSLGTIDSNYIFQTLESKYQAGGIVVAKGGTAIIKNNNVTLTDLAGIIVGDSSKAEVINNDVYLNKNVGIRVDSTNYNIKISGNRISQNQSLGILVIWAKTEISRNLLVDNASGGISSDEMSISHIYNNTIVHKGDVQGKGINISSTGSKVTNNIIYGYTVGIFKTNAPFIDYNCTFKNSGYNGPPSTGGTHALAVDPKFIDFDKNNYHLSIESPCIDKGNPDVIYNDPDGSISDIGCYPYVEGNDVEYDLENSNNNIEIYPNPAVNYIGIKGLAEQNCKVSIYSPNGSIFYDGVGIDRIDISTFPAGIYFIRIDNNQSTFIRKFVKIR